MNTLHEIVENIWLDTQDIDSVFRNKKRYMIVKHAKEGLKELQMTFATHISAMNTNIPSSCKVYKPDGFETFIRAYVFDCDGKTWEISRNNKVPTGIFQYLTDCDDTILKNCGDEDLYVDCIVCNDKIVDGEVCVCECCHGTGRCFSPEAAFLYEALERYKDSWVKEKNSNRYLEFSPDLEGMNIIIEYLSNNTVGVEECAINVDENLSNALEYFIKFKLLENGAETEARSLSYWRKFKAIRDKELTKENALTKTDLYGLLLLK